ncbi:MAG: FumA C-terminus/TtdB family hydratase beta subunit [Clostridiales bacterium]|nr:FumA C-terminus/TtdB family hydratase beta subunit [Clostridiales bacterium]
MAQRTFNITTAELKSVIPQLAVGDRVYLSGTVYTSRDAAHKRIFQLLDSGGELPFPIENSIVYYAGPTPAKNGMAVGSCGPTTSSRMDAFAPRLLDLGMIGMIGKGDRSREVIEAIKRNGAIYLCAVGGAGALIARCITSAEEIAFHDLGCESVKILTISELPLIVGIDAAGNSIFERNK